MEGVTIVETEALNCLISRIDRMEEMFKKSMEVLESDGRLYVSPKLVS